MDVAAIRGLPMTNLPAWIAAAGLGTGLLTGGASLYSSIQASFATVDLRVTALERRADTSTATAATILDQLTNIRIDVGILKRRSDQKTDAVP